ncbi:hypothetical protein KRP22_006324 [Phytophthora ramorum]|nr:hypothetical protein KRP22_2543 [Phytophthora ramorum]
MPRLEDFFTHGGGAEFCAGSSAPDDSKASGPEASPLREGGQVHKGKNVVLVMCGDAGASQQPAASEIVPLTACTKCRLPVQTGEVHSAWSRIRIKYLRSSTELQHFLCSLHVVDKETSVLLIDGFERFFADQSHMGNVYQTLAYLLEAQDYMKTATGSGVAVVAGNTDAFLLRDRPLLRRWCRFLEIVSDEEKPGVFTLREEVENAVDVGEDVARTQVRYEFSLPVDEEGGNFQLLLVQTRSE